MTRVTIIYIGALGLLRVSHRTAVLADHSTNCTVKTCTNSIKYNHIGYNARQLSMGVFFQSPKFIYGYQLLVESIMNFSLLK